MAPLHGGSSAGKSDLCCGHSLDVVGRPGLHQSGLMSICFAGCFSPGPQKNDLTIYWALGPFVRSFTLLVDPGDIYPPHPPQHILNCLVLVEVDLTNPGPIFAMAKLAVLVGLMTKVVSGLLRILAIFELLNQIRCIRSYLRPIKSLSEDLPQQRSRSNVRSTQSCMYFLHQLYTFSSG
jgi:hypothetical protein